jgi:hypothetical protein
MRAAGAGATQYVNDAVASSANNAGAAR